MRKQSLYKVPLRSENAAVHNLIRSSEETIMAEKKSKHTFVVSDEKNPKITVKPGMKLEVVTVSLVDSTLKKPKKIAARLCGGTSTCLALVET